jgi:hypothetical protein
VTGNAMSAAERMRRYRARLLAMGALPSRTREKDPFLGSIRFGPGSLLSPSEREVVRRFVANLRRLPNPPSRLGVFGSRARGGSTIGSDLDVAVFVDEPDARLERRILDAAERAHAPYSVDGAAIILRPVLLSLQPRSAFHLAIIGSMETVWKKPGSPSR